MVKKAQKTKGRLHFTAPANLKLKDFADNDLIVPGRLDDKEAYAPLDFTSISSREVGKQHSYWAVRHSHLIFLLGNVRAEVGNIKFDLKNAEAVWMGKHVGDFKNKWEAEYAMGRRVAIKKLRRRLARAEASLSRYEALASSYEGLRNAASREIARRSDERASRD